MIESNVFKKFFFKKTKKNTANVAKLRLQAALSNDKKKISMDFFPKMEVEFLEVLRKYVEISKGDISSDLKKVGGEEVLNFNVTFKRKKTA
jgi:cell division topological specificity factor MinE